MKYRPGQVVYELGKISPIKLIAEAQETERELNSIKDILGIQSIKDIPQAITKLQERTAYLKQEIDNFNQMVEQ